MKIILIIGGSVVALVISIYWFFIPPSEALRDEASGITDSLLRDKELALVMAKNGIIINEMKVSAGNFRTVIYFYTNGESKPDAAVMNWISNRVKNRKYIHRLAIAFINGTDSNNFGDDYFRFSCSQP